MYLFLRSTISCLVWIEFGSVILAYCNVACSDANQLNTYLRAVRQSPRPHVLLPNFEGTSWCRRDRWRSGSVNDSIHAP